jgi:hypothetical protein
MPFCTKQSHIFLHWGKQQQHNWPLLPKYTSALLFRKLIHHQSITENFLLDAEVYWLPWAEGAIATVPVKKQSKYSCENVPFPLICLNFSYLGMVYLILNTSIIYPNINKFPYGQVSLSGKSSLWHLTQNLWNLCI